MIRHNVGDNKYTIIFYDDGSMKALRNGEPWRDLTGDGMVLAMLQEIDDLKEKQDQLEGHIQNLYDIINTGKES